MKSELNPLFIVRPLLKSVIIMIPIKGDTGCEPMPYGDRLFEIICESKAETIGADAKITLLVAVLNSFALSIIVKSEYISLFMRTILIPQQLRQLVFRQNLFQLFCPSIPGKRRSRHHLSCFLLKKPDQLEPTDHQL